MFRNCLLYSWIRFTWMSKSACGFTSILQTSRRYFARRFLFSSLTAIQASWKLESSACELNGDCQTDNEKQVPQLFEKLCISEECRWSKSISNQVGQFGVTYEHPSPKCDSIRDVYEFFWPKSVKSFEEIILENLCMKGSYTVHFVAHNNSQVCHSYFFGF